MRFGKIKGGKMKANVEIYINGDPVALSKEVNKDLRKQLQDLEDKLSEELRELREIRNILYRINPPPIVHEQISFSRNRPLRKCYLKPGSLHWYEVDDPEDIITGTEEVQHECNR